MIVLTDKYLEGPKARAVPGAVWDAEHRAWVVDPALMTDAAKLAARRLFPAVRDKIPAPEPPDTRPFDYATGWAKSLTPGTLLPRTPISMHNQLYPYQLADLGYLRARLINDGGGYLGWDRGLGKTLGALLLAEEIQAQRIVIVCPNSSKETVWRPEIEKWGFQWEVFNYGGTAAQRGRAFARWDERGGVLLVHYEGLRLTKWLVPVDLLIVDEAHRLANGHGGHKAPQFYKSLIKLNRNAKHRLLLSGSITVNSLEDIFGQAHIAFPNRYRSKWRDWCDRHLEYVEGHGRELVGVRPEAVEPLRRELAGWMVVRRKVDELPGLPSRLDQTLKVDLSPAQRKVYNDLATRMFATLPDGEVVLAPNVLSQLAKLRQVATGLDLLGEEFTDSAKIDLAVEMCRDNLPNKTVVFCWHKAAVRSVAERLRAAGVEVRTIDGDVSMTKRTEYVKEFQTNLDVKVMVATLKTLGESVTLHAAADLIFVESSWVPNDMEQAADRVYRIGQEKRVTVTTIVARDTIDEQRILPTSMEKAALRRAVLGV